MRLFPRARTSSWRPGWCIPSNPIPRPPGPPLQEADGVSLEGRDQDAKEVGSPCRKKPVQTGEASLGREELEGLERRESCSERTGMAFPGGGGVFHYWGVPAEVGC